MCGVSINIAENSTKPQKTQAYEKHKRRSNQYFATYPRGVEYEKQKTPSLLLKWTNAEATIYLNLHHNNEHSGVAYRFRSSLERLGQRPG